MNLGSEKKTTRKATLPATMRNIAWAAGFLEGEGCVHWWNCQLTASQVQREPLERLLNILGGNYWEHKRYTNKENRHPLTEWSVSGGRARGAMMTIYPFMSPKRQEEIRVALATKRIRGNAKEAIK